MTQYIEDNSAPEVREFGFNTQENATFGGNVSISGTLSVAGLSTVDNLTLGGNLVVGGTILGDRVVTNATAATLVPTAAQSGTVFTLNRAAGIAITLPGLTGTAPVGTNYEFIFATSASGGDTTITAASGDLLFGGVTAVDTDSSNAVVFDDPDGTDDLIMTFNGGTQGGLVGTIIRVVALTATSWHVSGFNRHSSNFATIFS